MIDPDLSPKLDPEVEKRLKARKQAYETFAQSPIYDEIMADLAAFCGADKVNFSPDNPHVTSFREGRREVYLRILQMGRPAPQQ